MRELIYVSTAKLQQILPDLPRGTKFKDFEGALEVKGPAGIGVKGEKKAAKAAAPALQQAVNVLEQSSRAPSWFASRDVRPGMWVHFEAPLTYRVLTWRDVTSLVFVDADVASPEYPTGGRLRLLLHGSAQHLLGARPGTADEAELRLRSSLWAEFADVLRGSLLGSPDDDADTRLPDQVVQRYADRIWDNVQDLTKSLQPNYTSAWLAGYARVTALMPTVDGTVLAASPLYVEHIDSPEPGASH
ncbi:hypothetical protein DMP23_19100 [Amycolatopsis sp. A1MSW2902]|uniref:SAVMC3_10250 family protein n=1 Tax=Amycolatopsis sp. A1MSW2902 TaxID=687413 RepID=UPI00307EC17C